MKLSSHKDNTQTDLDLSQFPWQEKLKWLSGYDLWSLHAIPSSSSSTTTRTTSILLSDGPHGVRKPLHDLSLSEAFPATCFPSACATACSWDVDLLRTMGNALALECQHYDIQVLLGPGVNLKRYPGGGRNHEYFSEDPVLTGKLACGYIQGVQESGHVAACIKHFCLNNQESHRMVVNVIVDERTMRELYLPAFEMTIVRRRRQQQPKLVMGAYNQVMGEHCCQSPKLLQNFLRDEWKYDGVVVSDWAAVNNRVEAIRAGLDLEMPGSQGAYDHEVKEAIEDGRLSVSDIDACAQRVVKLVKEYEPKERKRSEGTQGGDKNTQQSDVTDQQSLFGRHDQLAREIARECIVLLQNRDNLLPLSKTRMCNLAVIGDFARDHPRFQGMGSAHTTPTKVSSVYSALLAYLNGNMTNQDEKANGSIPFARGYDINADDDEIQQSLIDESVEVAKQGTVVVLCVGVPEIMESEGFDRPHLRLPKQHVSLVESVCRVHSDVVVILSNGGIVEIPDSFLHGPKAILDGFLLGQAGGIALVDVLVGNVSPSGKLPETIPICATDIPSGFYFPGTRDTVQYREGLDVGYRYFDTNNVPVRFPFGHGLSYTSFEYRNLQVEIRRDDAEAKCVIVSLNVQNVGSTDGKEVIQVYVRPINSTVYRPLHELKDFCKVQLVSGETKTLTFELNERCFALYDIGIHDWIVESAPCQFELQVGASSRDIRLFKTIQFETGKETSSLARESYPPMQYTTIIDDEIFAKRFGSLKRYILDLLSEERQKVEHSSIKKRTEIHRNTLLKEAASVSLLGMALLFFTVRVASKDVKEGAARKRHLRMIRANVENLPLRNLVLFSKGHLSFRLLDSLIFVMNGNYLKALRCRKQ